MELYEVGQVIPNFIGHDEGIIFDMADDGARVMVFFNKPTIDEVEQFKSSHNFEIRFVQLYNVIMITTKIGSLNWMDAPYTPHLSKSLTKYQLPQEGQGLGLQLYLIDSSNGQIKTIRLLGLSEKFTKSLFGTLMEEKVKEFDKMEYQNNMNRIFSTYPTKKLVVMSKDYFKM